MSELAPRLLRTALAGDHRMLERHIRASDLGRTEPAAFAMSAVVVLGGSEAESRGYRALTQLELGMGRELLSVGHLAAARRTAERRPDLARAVFGHPTSRRLMKRHPFLRLPREEQLVKCLRTLLRDPEFVEEHPDLFAEDDGDAPLAVGAGWGWQGALKARVQGPKTVAELREHGRALIGRTVAERPEHRALPVMDALHRAAWPGRDPVDLEEVRGALREAADGPGGGPMDEAVRLLGLHGVYDTSTRLRDRDAAVEALERIRVEISPRGRDLPALTLARARLERRVGNEREATRLAASLLRQRGPAIRGGAADLLVSMGAGDLVTRSGVVLAVAELPARRGGIPV